LPQGFVIRVDNTYSCNDNPDPICNTVGCGEFSTPEAVLNTCGVPCTTPGCANDQCNADPSLQAKFTEAAFGGEHTDIADPAVGFDNWTCVERANTENYCSCVPDPEAMRPPNPQFFTSNGCGGVWFNRATCPPLTCQSQGYICGRQADGCGGQLDCPACPTGQYCNGNGTACLPCLREERACGADSECCSNRCRHGRCTEGDDN